MKWRVLVLLIAGITMIYLVSLSQDIPYPHPLIVQTFEPKQTRVNEPKEVILSETRDYIYRTHIHYEAAIDSNAGFITGVDSIKLNVYGLIIQARKRKDAFFAEATEEEWEVCFKHLLRGPISKVSKAPVDSGILQFAVLYHTLFDDNVKHYTRVYYLTKDNDGNPSFEYKDLVLPGNTMINGLSLEQDSILYSRNPDTYRFRVATLPENLTFPPHSINSSIIALDDGQTGDLVKLYHQPRKTESHATLLCRLYSPNMETYRAFTLDIHKTKYWFHTNVSIVDGTVKNPNEHGISKGKWIFRDHLNTKDSTISEDNMEYMSYVDGAHFHQERTFINMPVPSISRSRDSKTAIVSLIKNDLLVLDFTDNLSAHKKNKKDERYLYKTENGDIIPEFYHTVQLQDSLHPSETAYDSTDIRGVQLNADGTLLAVWTESNSIYIYKRGSAGQTLQADWFDSISKNFDTSSDKNKLGSPHHLETPLEWDLSMVITPREGHIGLIAPIGNTLFWKHEGQNYIAVGMKNHIVNTYLIDKVKEQPSVNFKSFIRDKWDLWIAMSMVITIFVVNEYKSYPA